MPPMPRCNSSSNLMLLSTYSAQIRRSPGSRQGIIVFDLADKHLEVAHNFCELPFYRFLRSGDYKADLKNVKDKFSILFEIASAETKRLNQTREQTPLVFEPKREEGGGLKLQLPSASCAGIRPTSNPQAPPNKTH